LLAAAAQKLGRHWPLGTFFFLSAHGRVRAAAAAMPWTQVLAVAAPWMQVLTVAAPWMQVLTALVVVPLHWARELVLSAA